MDNPKEIVNEALRVYIEDQEAEARQSPSEQATKEAETRASKADNVFQKLNNGDLALRSGNLPNTVSVMSPQHDWREVDIECGEALVVEDGSRYASVSLNENGGLHVEVADESGDDLQVLPQDHSEIATRSVTINTTPPKDFKEYTVVGTSANHPGGYTRMVKATSSEAAKEQVNAPTESVAAVFEGHLTNPQ